MRIFIKTLGCKANRAESDALFEEILGDGHQVFELNEGIKGTFERFSEDSPDVLIVNTCTVTENADKKSKQAIRGLGKAYPEAHLVVFGCGGRVSGKEYLEMEEVDKLAIDRQELVGIIAKVRDMKGRSEETGAREKRNTDFGCIEGDFGNENGLRTRGLVKIQDGCNNYCTYCIIPRARGPEVSYLSRKILSEVKEKAAKGYQEIVLTGIVISSWKEGEMDIADLIEFLIENTNDVRFRLGSIEPQHFSDKFYDLLSGGRLCPHMHMSLQSGSDSVLVRMRRNYDKRLFQEVCERLRNVRPDIGLTTDVIVGFPGETEEEFEESMDFVREIGFLKVHVFPYSRRKDTAAYYMENQVNNALKKERAGKMRGLSDELRREFIESVLGNEYEMLVENCENGICKGFTENYVPVMVGGEDLVNKMVKVKLLGVNENGDIEGVIS